MLNSNDIDFNPILQIVNLSTKFRKSTLNSAEHAQKQVALEVSNKSGCCLTVKMASQSNNASRNLKSGRIVEIPMFQILKYSCENNGIQHSIASRAKLKIIGFDAKLVEMRKVKVAIEKVSSSNNSIIMKKEENLLKENKILTNNQCNKCKGEICSSIGLHFSARITKMRKIELIDFADISNECYFIKDTDKIENNNKLCRFLLCWWFATNAHLISGKAIGLNHLIA